jgi:glycosyltransferase involved in cell wall biosynthesis
LLIKKISLQKQTSQIPVSVIIPTYNYAHYISEAIESILKQDYAGEKIEIIVVDDGSTDNTKEVLSAYIQNNQIQYYYQPNKGKANATYNAIQKCTGKYIFNLDADDYFLPNKIITTVTIFEVDDDIVHVASPAKFFDDQNKILKDAESIPAELLNKKMNGSTVLNFFYRNNIFYGSGSTLAARTSVLKKINIPTEVDMYIDEFLVLAILPVGKSFFVKEPLSVWRMHVTNYSGELNDATQQKIKNQRLLTSSAAVLKCLEENNYDKALLKIYRLKNSNRFIAYKEASKTKTLKDIWQYAKEIFFDIKPGWHLIKKYQVLNRFLPLSFYLFLKKLSK